VDSGSGDGIPLENGTVKENETSEIQETKKVI
jgi:hypothetical protein